MLDRVGEIWVSGSSVAQGYWNPIVTQAVYQFISIIHSDDKDKNYPDKN